MFMAPMDERQRLIHELRNAIQVIESNLVPLRHEVTTAEGRDIVADIETAAGRVTRICHALTRMLESLG